MPFGLGDLRVNVPSIFGRAVRPVLDVAKKFVQPRVAPPAPPEQQKKQQQLKTDRSLPDVQAMLPPQIKQLRVNIGQRLAQIPTTEQIIPKVSKVSPLLTNVLPRNPLDRAITDIALDIPRSFGRTLARTKPFEQRTFGEKVEDVGNIAFFLPAGRVAGSLQGIKRYSQYAQRVLDKDARSKIGFFSELVEKGRDKRNLGALGQEVQAMAEDIFGQRARGWSNKQLKQAFDLVFEKVSEKGVPGFGLSVGELTRGDNVLADIQKGFKLGTKAKEGKQAVSMFDRIRTQLVDRLTPLFDLEKKAGKELAAETSPYKRFRLLAGVGGEVRSFTEQNLIKPILKPIAQQGQLDDLSTLLILDRNEEIAKRGLKTRYSLEQIGQARQALQTKLGDSYQGIEKAAQGVRQYANGLLDELFNAGIIDKASYSAIKAKNQAYVPLQIVDYISDNLDKGQFGRTSFNVATQDVIKTLKGSELQAADPLEALLERTGKVIGLARRNQAMRAFTKLPQENNIFSGLIKRAEGVIPQGFDTVNVFENGQNIKYIAPKEVVDALKNVDQQTANILTDILRPQAALLRAGATALNIGFIPINILRDMQDALFATYAAGKKGGVKGVGQFLLSYPRAMAAALKQDELYNQWLQSGGAQSTFISQFIKESPQTIKNIKGQGAIRTILSTPADTLRFLNRIGEEPTRIARFQAELKRGESLAEAAFQSRDVTIDFAKSGNIIKHLNQVIPFLNAGIQGTEKMFRIFKNNPMQAILGASILGGAPTTLLYQHNRQFQDYQDIPQFEKDQYWIILARDRTEAERATGAPIVGVKIPKPFLVRPLANGAESFLSFVDQKNPQTLTGFLGNTLENLSPVGIPGTGRFFSQVLPPGLQAGVESVTNKNLFTGFPIVPQRLQDVTPSEQYRETTPGIYRAFGKLTGISPLIAENVVRTTTGGLGQQIARGVSGDPLGATAGEFGRRFFDVRGGADVDKLFDEVEDIKTVSRTTTLKKQREAEKLFAELKQGTDQEARQQLLALAQENPDLVERVLDVAETETQGITALDRSIKALPVQDGARATFITKQLDKLQTNEEKKQYLMELAGKKILTEDVFDQVLFLVEKNTAQVNR